MSGQQCAECGCDITEETGWGFTTTLAEDSPYTWFCGEHAPNKGKGYTLADLEQWREQSKVAQARYEMSLMEKVGPDIYFAFHAARQREERRHHMRSMHQTMTTMMDTLNQLGVLPEDPS